MPNEPIAAEQVLELLAHNPKRIAELTGALTPAQLRTAPGPDEWSANDVLAHLRCCADVWGKGLRTIIEKDEPTIRHLSPRGWIKQTNYLELEFGRSLREFETHRGELLALLRPLAPKAWTRKATVRASGSDRTWTLLSYAERLATHEQHHLAQFARIADAVGTPSRRTLDRYERQNGGGLTSRGS